MLERLLASIAFSLLTCSAIAADCLSLGRIDTSVGERNSVYHEYRVKIIVDNTCKDARDIRVKACMFAKNGQQLTCTYASGYIDSYRMEILYGRILVDANAAPYVEEVRAVLGGY